MGIETYNAQIHGPLDGTPGYNDFILSCRGTADGDSCKINYVDGLPVDPDNPGIIDTVSISSGYRFPSEALARRALSYSINQGARIFKLSGGGYILRRSIYDDRCTGDITLARQYDLTSTQLRAVAVFSGTDHDNMWCYAPGSGRKYAESERRPYQTPWNLQSPEGLAAFKGAIEKVINASKNLTDMDREGLRTILTEIDGRLGQLKDGSYLDQPWYVLVMHAAIFGALFWGMAKLGDAILAAIKNIGGDDDNGSGGSGGNRIEQLEARLAELEARSVQPQSDGQTNAFHIVSTENGGLIYANWVWIDGQDFGLDFPPEVAKQLQGRSFTADEFIQAVESLTPVVGPVLNPVTQGLLNYYQTAETAVDGLTTPMTSVPGAPTALQAGSSPIVVPRPVAGFQLPSLPTLRIPTILRPGPVLRPVPL